MRRTPRQKAAPDKIRAKWTQEKRETHGRRISRVMQEKALTKDYVPSPEDPLPHGAKPTVHGLYQLPDGRRVTRAVLLSMKDPSLIW